MMAGEADSASQLAEGVAREFRRRLLGEYVPRIRQCVALLNEHQCWEKPGPSCNSIGNLIVHLEGNVRQWILAGLGDTEDHRNRGAEFALSPERALPVATLLDRLESTVSASCGVVERLGPAELLRLRRFQQVFEETGLAAVLHVLEHFSGHAGQIYAWTKQLTGRDLRFYDL